MANPAPPPLPLPENSVLLHVGPHKTGTSALQRAFHEAREQHAEQGVHYAGSGYQPYLAARAFTGVDGPEGDPPATPAHRAALIREVKKATAPRVMISSERFADADDDAARQIVDALGGGRLYVAITLRPLAKLLPSHWQQAVRNGMRQPYRQWLKTTLAEPIEASTATTFWRRHAHDRFVARWAAAAGADHVVVVVVDDADRRSMFDAFESLLGLPNQSLQPPAEIINRSLTLPEIELIRRLNQQFHQREWSGKLYRAAVRFGAVPAIRDRDPDPDDPAIWTPEWALQRAAEIGSAAAKGIEASGVHVIGDLGVLGWRPAPGSIRRPPDNDDLRLSVEGAALAVMGAIEGAERITAKEAGSSQAARPAARLPSGVRRRLRAFRH